MHKQQTQNPEEGNLSTEDMRERTLSYAPELSQKIVRPIQSGSSSGCALHIGAAPVDCPPSLWKLFEILYSWSDYIK